MTLNVNSFVYTVNYLRLFCNVYKIWTQLCALSTLGSKSKSMLTCTVEEMENRHRQHGEHRQLQEC